RLAGGYGPAAAQTATAVKKNINTNLQAMVRVVPFLFVVLSVLFALYGGLATPAEAAGAGAMLCLFLAVVIYRIWRLRPLQQILRDTLSESVMIMLIIGAAGVFAFALSSLFITQTVAASIAALEINRWALMAIINMFLLLCGMFAP